MASGNDNPPEIEALYPDDSAPEPRMGKLGALCSFGLTPRAMTGFIVQIMRQHFCDATNIHNHFLRGVLQKHGVWNAGETTGLYVEDVAVWRPELTEARPAIVTKEGDWQWRRVGIGDQAGQTWQTGKQFFGGLWQGTHTVFALGNEPAETQILGNEVAKVLLWYSQRIMADLGLHRFVMVSIGALRKLKESKDNYVVPISIAYVKWESWSLQEEAPRLKRIVLDVTELLGG